MEELMQYVWHHRLWLAGDLKTVDGDPVAVIDVGQHNRDAGPDFFNSKVKIGDQFWCGNVEMHLRASDWYRHGHNDNPAYHTVILHVVETNDCRVTRPDGTVIPQMVLPTAKDFAERYGRFVNNPANELACAGSIGELPQVMIHSWLDSLAFERLNDKEDAILRRLDQCNGDWQQAAFITLARAMGSGINGDAFERVAASLPLRLLHKHSDSLLQLEAMLFGQAGLLDGAHSDSYVEHLRREYDFLRDKFGLHQPQSLGWRMSRMRPASFPHRRLATLAQMIHNGFSLFRMAIEAADADQARKIFQTTLSGYWLDHYTFGSPLPFIRPEALGVDMVNMLVINVAVPLMSTYAHQTANDELADRALDIIEQIPAEKNRFVKHFINAGISCPNALVSQAMVQLHRNYCDTRKCLYCRLGHRILASKARP